MALSDLTPQDLDVGKAGSQYTYEQKVMAVATWFVEQNLKRASEQSGVPHSTLRAWKTRASWWNKVLHEIQKEHKDRFCADLYGIVGAGLGEVRDRLKNGDEVMNVDYEYEPMYDDAGQPVLDSKGSHKHKKVRVVHKDRVKIKGKDAMIIAATAQDKLERFENGGLLEEVDSVAERLNNIASTLENKFKDLQGKLYEHDDIEDAELIGDDDNEGRVGEAPGSCPLEGEEEQDRRGDGQSPWRDEKEKEEEEV